MPLRHCFHRRARKTADAARVIVGIIARKWRDRLDCLESCCQTRVEIEKLRKQETLGRSPGCRRLFILSEYHIAGAVALEARGLSSHGRRNYVKWYYRVYIRFVSACTRRVDFRAGSHKCDPSSAKGASERILCIVFSIHLLTWGGELASLSIHEHWIHLVTVFRIAYPLVISRKYSS
jgi:hypothetical protein